jgi:hypothetical protein
MSLWNLSTYQGRACLLVQPGQLDSSTKARSIVSMVPGAKFNNGMVQGPPAVLATCLRLAGQDLPLRLEVDRFVTGNLPASAPGALSWMPPYQRMAASFIASRLKHGVMVNDDLGLGKTFEVIGGLFLANPQQYRDELRIDLAAGTPAAKAPVNVVLCPAGLRRQWESEIKKWHSKHALSQMIDNANPNLSMTGEVTPDPTVHVLYPKSDKRSKRPCPPDVDWIIAYYMDTERVAELVKSRSYNLIIDEVHNLTGWRTQRMQKVNSLRTFAMGCVTMTASDLTNRMDGLYSILNLTSPGHWGSPGEFAGRYAHGTRGSQFDDLIWGELDNEEELRFRRSFYGFRRVKQDVADQLPFDTKYQTIWVEPPAGTVKHGARSGATSEYLEAIADLKLPVVAEQINSDIHAGIPGLTGTWTKDQARFLGALVPGSLVVHGDDGNKDRLEAIYAYVGKCAQLGRVPQVIGTYDSIGTGGNLQMFKAVNCAAMFHTPELVRQFIGRAARMGQQGTVTARLFAMKYSYDERLLELMVKKLKSSEALDGREEPEKRGLIDALAPEETTDFLQAMLAKYQEMEVET